MWQILLGIYTIVVTLSIIIIWSALVLAKKSDRNLEDRWQPITETTPDKPERIQGFNPSAR